MEENSSVAPCCLTALLLILDGSHVAVSFGPNLQATEVDPLRHFGVGVGVGRRRGLEQAAHASTSGRAGGGGPQQIGQLA